MDDLSTMSQGLGPDPGASLAKLAGAVRDEGGLDSLVGKLQEAGYGGAVDTWVGGGPNEPVDPQALGAALGDDEIQRLSSKSGIDIASLLPVLAMFLPQIINMLTPRGEVPDGGLDQAAAQQPVPDLGSVLGGVLGGATSGGSGGSASLDDLLGSLGGLMAGGRRS